MNPFADSYEQELIRKIFLWVTVFFVVVFGTGCLLQVQNGGIQSSMSLWIITLRGFSAVFNTAILVWLRMNRVKDSFFLPVPALATLANFLLSTLIMVTAGGNLLVNLGAYLVISLVYLLVFGFFIRNQGSTMAFGVFLILGGIALFDLFPDKVFRQVLSVTDLRNGLSYILFFGLLSVTILVYINNKVAGILMKRARDYAVQLQHLAYIDQTSGLANGLQLELDMRETENLSPANLDEKLVMAGFRLDGLEALNETAGLEFTNQLIKNIVCSYEAELQANAVRHPDYASPPPFKVLYRVESSIFVFLMRLPPGSIKSVSSQAILSKIIQSQILQHQGRISLTFQGGLTFFPDDADSLQQLLRNLLNLLHTRRTENLGQFVSFNPAHYQEFIREEQVRTGLLEALQNREVYLVYQPKVEIESGQIKGFEALARWKSPALGMVSPAEFIPLAEKSGIIETLTRQLMEEAFDFIRSLRKEGHPAIRVSVNLSPGILNAAFLDFLIQTLKDNGLGESLELEITEGILVKLNPMVTAKFSELKHSGVVFSIDDFGTGYSNLGYLQSFEADTLKIDKRFIDGTPLDEKNSKLVMAILQMARSFDMKVVAEGVEYQEQRDFLLAHACDQIQGYFYSKPLPGDEALRFLKKDAGAGRMNNGDD